MYVCALHNAGVKVSGLIFYLSGLITIAFTAALLRSVEDTASLLNLYWEREKKKKLHVYNLNRGAIKCYSCTRSQCSRCFTASYLSVGSNKKNSFHL